MPDSVRIGYTETERRVRLSMTGESNGPEYAGSIRACAREDVAAQHDSGSMHRSDLTQVMAEVTVRYTTPYQRGISWYH